MTTNLAFASGDGYIDSSSTSYATAQGGSGLVVSGAGTTNRMGQNKISTTYHIYEAFYAFPYTLDSTVFVVTAYFDFFVDTTTGTGVIKNWGLRDFAWGTLDTTDWRTPSQITALTRYGYADSVSAVQGQHVYASESSLDDWLNGTTGTKQVILYNDRITSGSVPTGPEYSDIRSIEYSGTATDPVLVWTTIPIHTLARVGGCAIELSDGQHVYIEADGGGISTGFGSPVLTLKRHDGTTATNIATNLLSSGRDMGSSNHGMQQYALTRDDSDNIYWVGHAAGAGNTLNIVTWKKTGTNTWQEMGYKQADMPAANGIINNLGMAWHKVGVGGTLMIVGGHENLGMGPDPSNEMFYALINCDNLLNSSGALVRASGSAFAAGLVGPWSLAGDWNQSINPVGTDLDVVALPNSTSRGVVLCQNRDSELGTYTPIGIVRYQLNTTTAVLAYVHECTNVDAWSTKDAGAKVRVLPISESRWVVCTLDMDSGWGPILRVVQNIGTSTTFTELGGVLLHGESIASLPAPSAMHDKFTWDAIYQPEENNVWFYYFDTASPYRLMRTCFDLDTYKAVKNEIQVAASVVGSGTNHGIRVDRGKLTKSEVLIAVSNRSVGGVQTTTYLVDKLNVSPLAPTLVDKTNYDATQAANFDWTFNDPNVGDTQTAFQLVIENSDTGAVAHDTGKVTSAVTDRTVTAGTLTNGNNYRWKVRTYDTSDAVGPYSAYDFFVASASGTVTITSPATDNPTWLLDTVTLTWSTSGITQTKYRVRVVRTDTGAQVSDTGFVTSTATTWTSAVLQSDLEYRFEVTVQNVSAVNSNTAIRLVTPNYNEPEVPLISVSAVNNGGYNAISIANPTPQGDRPEAAYNFVQRKLPEDSAWTSIAQIVTNGSYKDYAVASGTSYVYRVMAVASIGYSLSIEYEVTLVLEGVWLHRPYDPEGSAKNYRFGSNQRGDQLQASVQLTQYAGREYPVADFAHYQSEATSVTVDVPFGDTWAQDLVDLRALERTRETLVFRDNRGRQLYGIIAGMSFSDTAWGTQVSWDHQRVDYDESVD